MSGPISAAIPSATSPRLGMNTRKASRGLDRHERALPSSQWYVSDAPATESPIASGGATRYVVHEVSPHEPLPSTHLHEERAACNGTQRHATECNTRPHRSNHAEGGSAHSIRHEASAWQHTAASSPHLKAVMMGQCHK